MTQVVVVFHLRAGSEPEAEKLAAADPMGAEYSVSPGTQLIGWAVGVEHLCWKSVAKSAAIWYSRARVNLLYRAASVYIERPAATTMPLSDPNRLSECVNLSEIGLRGEFVFVQQPAKAGTTSASRDRASDQKHTVPNLA
jgi:hypothetical protein